MDKVVQDSLKIVKAVRYHLAEKDCKHSIKEIVRVALGLTDLAQDQISESLLKRTKMETDTNV